MKTLKNKLITLLLLSFLSISVSAATGKQKPPARSHVEPVQLYSADFWKF